ncbi:hypothetical protein JAAARDRAFT_37970 [Jaapia argillacea MUCL 33604]|uniref:PRELI/MSF1 domain-containing protein n=1 Tax=Jaapia argillacea MUCL 33604 TaxID=933084 RepID=A0A067PU94_9AGAM|nr:hypothetical protein JAAARDRAFT_37970 [Jaapia argillacea MUCL 33604]
MRFFSQSFLYDEPWSIVSLAYFLRYPNPYASHVLSCDVISRTLTSTGTLLTTRLILKQGALPRWAPQGMVPRSESWVIEESEVDPYGKVVRCQSRNLDHVKVMSAQESVVLKPTEDGKTLQRTDVSIVSGFGWGLTKRIESYGLAKFKSNIQRSREGLKTILELVRHSHSHRMTLGLSTPNSPNTFANSDSTPSFNREGESSHRADAPPPLRRSNSSWTSLSRWLRAA